MKRVAIFLLLMSPCPVMAQQESGSGETVRQLLGQLLNAPQPGRSHTIDEGELNAFVQAELQRRPHPGVEAVQVELLEGSFLTNLTINLDEVDLSEEGSALGLLSYLLTGTQQLQVRGLIRTQDGVGSYQTEEASLNGLTLPASVLDTILSSVGRRQDPPFDPTQPFQLPYGIKTVTLKEGAVELGT